MKEIGVCLFLRLLCCPYTNIQCFPYKIIIFCLEGTWYIVGLAMTDKYKYRKEKGPMLVLPKKWIFVVFVVYNNAFAFVIK